MSVLLLINLGLLTSDRIYSPFYLLDMQQIVLLICQFLHRGVYLLKFDNTHVGFAAVQIRFGNSQMQTNFKLKTIALTSFRFYSSILPPRSPPCILVCFICILCNL